MACGLGYDTRISSQVTSGAAIRVAKAPQASRYRACGLDVRTAGAWLRWGRDGFVHSDDSSLWRDLLGPGGDRRKYNKLTWRAAVDHHFSDAVMGYAAVSRGFKSGASSGAKAMAINNQSTKRLTKYSKLALIEL